MPWRKIPCKTHLAEDTWTAVKRASRLVSRLTGNRKTRSCLVGWWAGIVIVAGCATSGPATRSAERGLQGTVAYRVRVEASEPGVRIEANQEYVGTTPLDLKVFGDKDGTFHCFDNPDFIIRAVPVKPGQHGHAKYFHTGDFFTGEDQIPKRVFFDMMQPERSVADGSAPLW